MHRDPLDSRDLADLESFALWLRKRARSEGTIRLYLSCLRGALGSTTLLEPILDRDRSPKGRWAIRSALRSWARWQKDDKLLDELREIKLPPDDPEGIKQPLQAGERAALLAAIDSMSFPARPVLGIIAVRGLRVSDVLRLTRLEVVNGLSAGILAGEAKGGLRQKYGVRPIREYLEMLTSRDGWKRVDELVAPSSKASARRKTAVTYVERWVHRAAASAGLDPAKIYPHRFRHTVATMMLDEFHGNIGKLAKFMGWRSEKTALNYVSYLSPEEIDRAEDALKK